MIDTLTHDSCGTFRTDLEGDAHLVVDREEVLFLRVFVAQETVVHDHESIQ